MTLPVRLASHAADALRVPATMTALRETGVDLGEAEALHPYYRADGLDVFAAWAKMLDALFVVDAEPVAPPVKKRHWQFARVLGKR